MVFVYWGFLTGSLLLVAWRCSIAGIDGLFTSDILTTVVCSSVALICALGLWFMRKERVQVMNRETVQKLAYRYLYKKPDAARFLSLRRDYPKETDIIDYYYNRYSEETLHLYHNYFDLDMNDLNALCFRLNMLWKIDEESAQLCDWGFYLNEVKRYRDTKQA